MHRTTERPKKWCTNADFVHLGVESRQVTGLNSGQIHQSVTLGPICPTTKATFFKAHHFLETISETTRALAQKGSLPAAREEKKRFC